MIFKEVNSEKFKDTPRQEASKMLADWGLVIHPPIHYLEEVEDY